MEKEKLTKNELKEKMIKKFDKGMVIAWAIRNFFIIMGAFYLLAIAIEIIIELVQPGGSNFIQTVIQVANEYITAYNFSAYSNSVFAICLILKYIVTIIICDRIGKVFKDSKEAGTPFCNANVRNIGIISEFAWIYSILGVEGFAGYELVMATLISVIYYIFKYGCELQEQSDETL